MSRRTLRRRRSSGTSCGTARCHPASGDCCNSHSGRRCLRIAGSGHALGREMVNASDVAFRALIVDDNDAFLEVAAALLTREGMDVVGVASNSRQALRLVEELRPDVVL